MSIIYAICIMAVGLAVMQVIPDVLLGFFDASETMLAIGVPALRIISLSFIFCRLLYCVGKCFSGAWKWYLQYDSVNRKTAFGAFAGGISSFKIWESGVCMVGISNSPPSPRSRLVQNVADAKLVRNLVKHRRFSIGSVGL